MSEHATVSSNVGTRLLFENDRVRVWDLRLEPGESTGLHEHSTDYFFVVIGDGTLEREDPGGVRRPPKQMRDGEVHFRPIGDHDIHAAVNVGQTTWRNIVVELKK